MPTAQRILRDACCAAIGDARQAGDYPINNFDLEATYLPTGDLPDVPDAGKVWIEYQANDDRLLTRAKSFQREIGIRVSYQRLVRDSKCLTAEIDKYDELLDAMRDTLRLLPDERFAYQRTEGMRDANGQPISFVYLRESNMFLGQFTAFFNTVLE